MDYSSNEKQILSMMERTDFKNISKTDIVSFASKINELRPEVAKQVLDKYPEFIGALKVALSEYKGELETIINSDDASVSNVYDIMNTKLSADMQSRSEYYEFADKIRNDCSKCLDNENLSPEERSEIFEREMEILRMVHDKESEIKESENETVKAAIVKDSEKRQFHWMTLCSAGTVIISVCAIAAGILGGKVDLKIPKQ